MSFIWPAFLVLLLLLPLFVLLYVRMQRRRAALAARYGSFGLVQGAGKEPGVRRHLPFACFLLALAVLIVAMARPQATVNLPRLEGTVILAFDVSASMSADDLEPTRLDAAKIAAQEFVLRQPPTVQVGVVAFSEGGLSVQVPTNTQEEVLAAIDRLTTQAGTSVGSGILASMNVIAADAALASDAPQPTPQDPATEGAAGDAPQYPSAVIVVLSDGENNGEPDPLEAAQVAANSGVRVFTVGLGSPEGATLELDGFTVHTQLQEEALQQIAQLTSGAYFNAAASEELPAIYDQVASQLVVKPEQTEITALLVGAGLALLLIGGLLSLLWFSRMP
jgi:Ca-activated chloride channel family protein